jgi:tRNA (cytidine/uridine-2'-O-)-methyltransferase
VVLVEPEIAANAGSIGRTCVAAGAMLWLVRPLGFHLTDRHRRRAGLDYWDHLRWQACDTLDEVIESVGHQRLWLLSTKGNRLYSEADFQAGDVLILGPESRALPAALLEKWPERVLRIPMHDAARSLNLAVASAVCVYEAMRQIGWPPGAQKNRASR